MANYSTFLSQKLAQLASKNVENLNTQENAMSAKELRCVLGAVIQQILDLTDPAAVSTKCSKDATGIPQSDLFWQLLQLCIDEFPDSLVEIVHRVPKDKLGLTRENVKTITSASEPSKAFTVLVLSRILRFLAEPGCIPLHNKAISAVHAIMQLIKSKDLVFYRRVLTEFVTLHGDLAIIEETLFGGTDEMCKENTLPLYLDHFQFFELKDILEKGESVNSEETKLAKKQIVICKEEDCGLLHEGISEIMCQVVGDVCHYANKEVDTLWRTCCLQLETGVSAIKQFGFKIITDLLTHSGLPTLPVFDDFVQKLCDVIDVITSGACQSALSSDKVIPLEQCLAVCLDNLLCETSESSNDSLPDSPWYAEPRVVPVFVLPAWHMELVLEQLCKSLESDGLGKLLTNELKSSLCHSIKYFYCHVPDDYCFSATKSSVLRYTINKALVQHVGMETEQQYMVGCLCQAINNEESYKQSNQTNTVKQEFAATSTQIKSPVIPYKKARTSLVTRKSSMTSKPSTSHQADEQEDSTLILLSQAMEKFMNDVFVLQQFSNDIMENILKTFEGVRIALEVIARSSEHLNVKQTKSFLTLMLSSLPKLALAADTKDTVALTTIGHIFKKLVDIVMLLFYVSESVTLLSELQQCHIFVVSIPWLFNVEQPWTDLPYSFGLSVQAMDRITKSLYSHIDNETKGNCLHLLAMFASDVAPTWRSQIFMLALQDPSSVITVQAIKWLPTLLCSLGSFSYSLVPDNLQKLLSMGTDIQKQVGMALGPLACVLTEHALVKRWVCPCYDEPIGKCIGLYCPVCDKKEGGSTQHAIVDAAVFTPYLHLLSPAVNSSVKLAFISSIPRICTHLAITPNTSAHSCIVTATCCDLIEDPDYLVRLAFSKVISYIIKPGASQNTGSPPISVMTKLKKAFNDASTYSRHQGKATRLQETVVLTIGKLGTTAEGELLLVVIISLLKSLTAKSKVIQAKAFQQIREIANCRNKTMNAVFSEFKQAICKFVVDAVHDVQSSNPSPKESLDVVTEVASVFEYRDNQSFLTSTQRWIIPHLVKKATSASSTVLRLLAKELQVGRREMLLENFKYIFSFLVRTCSPSELEKALGYVQKETDVELGSLLRSEAQSVYNQLLLYLSVSYDKVFSGLSMLASKDDTYTGPKDLKTAEDMANFLQSRLLGILSFYNTVLVTNSDLEEKKLALQSLVKLMEIMGPKYLTSVRVKVMGILRLGLRFKDTGFPELSCDAWECFVRNIELSCLGPMLSELVVTLLPYFDKLPSRVAKIYHFLIIENKIALNDYFHEIYFLPDAPELKKVNAVLRTACGIASRKMDLKTQFKRALKGVVHENLDVRRHALSKLKQLLHDNQTPLHDFVLSNDTVDPIIPEIVSVLISRCRETDPESKILVAECLGELGAVDPGRLDELTQVPVDEKPVHENGCDDMEFAEELINELARAFLAAHDTRAQDCSAYAIQEVLQVYECTEAKAEGLGFKLWGKFTEHIQEILRPHLYSKYLSSANPNWSRLAKPIYRSAKGKTFSDWTSTWTSYMITKVKEEKPARIFQACSKIFKHNIHTALFLLPHVIMYALLDGTQEDLNEVHTEIMSVLTHVQCNEDRATGSDFSHMSAQTIFSSLDYLNRWTQKKAHSFATKTQIIGSRSSSSCTSLRNERAKQHQIIQSFLQKIPQDVLASASFNCKAYTRALMHFEAFINNEKKNKQEHLGFLQKIYVALEEPDGVIGVAAIRDHKVTLHQQVLEHENSGKLRDASACYERAIQEEPNQVDHHKGLLNCLMGLGQVTNTLMHSNGTIAQRPEWKGSLNTFRVEAAWRLGQWDSLANFLKMERGRGDWSIGVGRILLAAKEKDEDSFDRQLRVIRSQQMGPLSAASMESGAYQRGYEYIARLHMLRELESCLGNALKDDSKPEIVEGWKSRLQITQKSFRTREQILNLRRAVLNLFPSTDDLKKELGASWLQSAKIARKEGHVQAAFSSLLNASAFSLPQVCIERAKWLWSKGDPHQALLSLQKGVSTHWGSSQSGRTIKAETEAERLIHAKALVLEGRWMEETAHYEPNPILKKFREVTDLHTNWENGHFYIGKYYDRLMLACLDEEKTNKLSGTDFIPFVIKHYGTSLQFGNKFIYQSMPRLLTIWLDFGAKVPDQGRSSKAPDKSGKKQKLMEANKLMAELTDKLPAYQFLTTFSLLISRICHPNQKVVEQLEEILAKLLVTYPQQAMWMMMAVSKSSFATRVNRCHKIFHKAKKQKSILGKFIDDATRLADRLLEVCNKGFNKNLAKDNKLSMSHDFSVLKRLVSDGNFSPIIVPLQSSMTVTLPSGAGSHVDHSPFPDTLACIIGFDETVEVLPSLQKPKKITVKGSDGKSYIMMCKPKDDLRKDSRTMEFNALINKCLRKDPESRRRQLHIRTYAVIPLNEECGLVEWVKNTQGLRNILNKIYKDKNMHTKSSELKKIIDRAGNSLESKVRVFKTELIPRHPPLFHEWFLTSFPNPTSWYQSRISYCRTTAVMSMVGYILGLGDRHGENILFDSTNGDCVHVDLNCLFNKGETFDCPERVPFRLTQNLINAMGLLGYEGVYRRSCEVTLRLMREQCDSLLTVLGTFIYDPLVEWQKIRGKDVSDAKNKETGEVTNEEAVKILKNIEQRLKGFHSKNRIMIPLSIEGQVHKLITEATDVQNLAQMYIGWAAFL